MANEYTIVDGIAFSKGTPEGVIKVILRYMGDWNQRIRIFLGDSKTGRDWCETYQTMGYVSKSGGQIKIPILVNNMNSIGGAGISTDAIVRITVNKITVYKHPKYHIGKITFKPSGYKDVPYGVFINGKNHANFKTAEKARKWAEFIQGNTNTKG